MFNPFRALKSWYGMKKLRRIFRRLEKIGFAPLPIIKGSVVPLPLNVNAGYQPTEAIKTQPPDVSSGVVPMSIHEVHQPDKDQYIICTTNCKGVITFPKSEGEKKKHKVYISLETAKRLIEKKRIPRLEKHIPLPAKKSDLRSCFVKPEALNYYCVVCPSCGSPFTAAFKVNAIDKKTRCKNCGQILDFKEVTKDD